MWPSIERAWAPRRGRSHGRPVTGRSRQAREASNCRALPGGGGPMVASSAANVRGAFSGMVDVLDSRGLYAHQEDHVLRHQL